MPDWRDAFRNRISPASSRLRRAILGGLGTAIAIFVMERAAEHFGRPLALIPFVTSIVLVLCLPEGDPARPRALIGGHLVSTLCGYGVLLALGSSSWTIALAVGLSAAAMHLTRTMHPPAGIDPLLIVHQHLGLDFLAWVVVPGSLILAIFARIWTRLSHRSGG